MGQFLSQQGNSNRSYDKRKRSTSTSRRSGRGRSYDSHFENDGTTSKESCRDYRHTSRARHQGTVQGERVHSHPLKDFNGNIGPPRRQQKYGRSKTSKDQDHQQLRRIDSHQSTDRTRNTRNEKTRSHVPRTGSHHERSRRTKECVICTDTRSLNHFPDRPPTVECTHENDVCRRCLRTWIASESSSKIWNEIDCPVCAKRLQYADMHDFAPRQVFHRYDKLTTKAVYESIPNFRWCISKGCKSGQVHPPGTSRFRCTACKKSHCVEHNVAWHRGETCREYEYRTNKHLKKEEEAASKKTILDTTKKCPGCKRNIEKSYGCDHMTCSKCKHEFCWQCLAPYAKKGMIRVVHRPGCTYFNPGWESD